jgi:hypothetical protein
LRFLTRLLHRFLANLFSFGPCFARGAEIFELVVGEVLDSDKGVVCGDPAIALPPFKMAESWDAVRHRQLPITTNDARTAPEQG